MSGKPGRKLRLALLGATMLIGLVSAISPMAGEPAVPMSVEILTNDVPDAAEVVHSYFARIRTQDPEVYKLFHQDAVLSGLGMQTRGREAIRDFYNQAIAEGGPQPRLAGPLLLDSRRIAAEIYIDLASGQTLHVVDLFVVEQGLIRSLTYFVASESSSSTAPSSHEQSESNPDPGRTP